jgi:hypothetical protein
MGDASLFRKFGAIEVSYNTFSDHLVIGQTTPGYRTALHLASAAQIDALEKAIEWVKAVRAGDLKTREGGPC